MKHFRFLVFALTMVLCTAPCYAQDKYEAYYKVEQSTYITTAPNAELCEYPLRRCNYVDVHMPHLKPFRDFIDTEGCKIKKIKKPTSLKVIRFANTIKQQGFNAYVVEYKDNVWLLDCKSVQDNSLINKRNAEIIKLKQDLDAEMQQLEAKKLALDQEKLKLDEEFKGVIEQRRKEYTDSLNYYKSLRVHLPKMLDSLRTVKEAEEQAKADKKYNDWYNSLSASAKKAATLISITEAGLSEPNSVGGCDYTLCYINKSKKTVKYLHLTGMVYNRVNDPAYCEIRRTASFKGVDTGPIAQDEEGGGTWENVVYNYAADTLKINSVSITYMDGSTATIAAADVKKLMAEPSTQVYVSTYDVEKLLMSDWDCRERIRHWQDKIYKLNNEQTSLKSNNARYGEIEKLLYSTTIAIKKLNGQLKIVDDFVNWKR